MNLKELSAHLGLSQTTVSRALNGYPEVNEGTRRKVSEAAARLGYSPNQRAKSLATGRTMSIGHVIPLSSQHEMVNVIFTDFIAGAGEVYGQHGYDMRLAVVPDANELEAYRKFARNGLVDGVIVHGPTVDDPRIPTLTELGLPFMVHGRSRQSDTPYAFMDVNNRRAFERATCFLLDLGHRRIGLLNGLEPMSFAVDRFAGYTAALSDRGLDLAEELIVRGEMTEPLGYNAMNMMLDQSNPPTAVIASSILPAFGAKRAIQDRGLKIGRDISVICWDDKISYLPNDTPEPIFTAMRSSVRAAGRRCATLLLQQITDPDMPMVNEIWEAELVLGKSTGPALIKKSSS